MSLQSTAVGWWTRAWCAACFRLSGCAAGSLVRKLVLERGVSFQPSIVELKLRGKDAQRAL